jgi:transglutaminase-like putative cysteine protease
MTPSRRKFLLGAAGLSAARALTLPTTALAAPAPPTFNPQPGNWRTFDVTTRIEVQDAQGSTRLWLPVPSVNSDWQQTLDNSWTSNGQAQLASDGLYGARMLQVNFNPGEAKPWVELTSRVRTRNRATNWEQRQAESLSARDRAFWLRPTALLPTDDIVRHTALQATQGAHSETDKVRAIYNWVVSNTYREPTVQGCGQGDIKTMLETGNLGGKCADINAVFVGLCRAAGIPARDVYGQRLAPSAFGYKQLGGNAASLQGAQHCRAEVFLAGHGWLAMDPADVTKVMRHEAPEWIKHTQHPLVAPVNQALFGGWEGNWMAFNTAHDIRLPGSNGPQLGFLMYPNGETAGERLDVYAPNDFKYRIWARELRV